MFSFLQVVNRFVPLERIRSVSDPDLSIHRLLSPFCLGRRRLAFLALGTLGLLLSLTRPTTAQSYNPNGTTVAGGNDQGKAANQLFNPQGIWVDAVGNLYVTDSYNQRIQKWARGATSGTTVAGGNGIGNAANQFNFPLGVWVDAAGNVYVADNGNYRIQKWAPGASQGVTVAGGNGQGEAANQFYSVNDVAVDAAGNVYVADADNNRVQKWVPGATSGTTVASGASTIDQFFEPLGVFVDATGNLYVADGSSSRILKFAPGAGANQGVIVAGGNKRGSAANQLANPTSVWVDAADNIYVADQLNHRIQKWTPGATSGTTIAGGNGQGEAANQLRAPQDVAVDAANNIYVSDPLNNRVQRFSPLVGPTISSLSASPNPVCVGGSVNFTATLGNVTGAYTYTLTNGAGSAKQGTASGTAFSQSLTATGSGTQRFTLTVANGGNTATATTTLTVTPQSQDYQPLVDLYTNTDGANWTRNDNWLTGCTPCGWYGVTCDGNGRVINLTLENNNLNGTIPASLSALTNLQVLRLVVNNRLTGPIPAGFSTLSDLRELSLQDNRLSGGIPGTLANLSNLKLLNLGQNLLSGSIPGSLSALTGLQVAYFNNNQLSGCFPASLSTVCGKLQFEGNPGLPGGGDFGAFCTRGAGSDAFRPLATARPNPVCAGNPVSLSVSAGTSYAWSGPAGFSASTQTPGFTPASAVSSGLYAVTVGNGSPTCTATASVNLTVNPLPPAPGLLTQTGQSYPGGQSSVTVDVNSGNVNLVVSGCNGTITWTGPAGSSGSTSPIVVSTDRVGTFVYNATCTSTQGCISPASSATVTVQGRLTVLHRDVDNYATNNAIQPLLQLQNQGSTALPLSAITLRYYVTVEGGGALSNLSVNYAQVGNQNVRLRYVPLVPAQQGAAGYVEVSFTAGAGSLAAGANSGAIQTYFAKGDYSGLNETDDYSYNPIRDQLTSTLRITAYYNGALIAGIEPGSTATVRAVRALTESRNGPSATQINTVLEVRNEGTVAINYSDLSARYYFTSDGNERLQVEVDEGNVSTQLVALSQPVAGANYYLEIRYNQAGQLAPGASTGAIRYRISKPDGGRFNQANDYSYQEQPQERSQNSRVVVLVGSNVVWGTPPSGSARLASGVEPGNELRVQLLGNPLEGDQVRIEVRGAQGQPLHLSVSDLTGRIVSQHHIEAAGVVEQPSINVGTSPAGLLLLKVSIPGQTQTLKVLKVR